MLNLSTMQQKETKQSYMNYSASLKVCKTLMDKMNER